MEFTDKYPHDPDFPYLVISASHGLVAKFKNPSEAQALKTMVGKTYGVATTLRQPIPNDFIYITWTRAHHPQYARRMDNMWIFENDKITEEELLRNYVGTAPIIGLQPTTSRLTNTDSFGHGNGIIQGR